MIRNSSVRFVIKDGKSVFDISKVYCRPCVSENSFSSQYPKKILARLEPSSDSIATYSICLYIMILKLN